MSVISGINAIKTIIAKMTTDSGKIARFSYTEKAFEDNDIEGVADYDSSLEQNIPLAANTDYNATVLNKGVRSQAASIPRNAENHFRGRTSYNVNKLNEQFASFLELFLEYGAENAGLYDKSMPYTYGSLCYTVAATDGKLLVTFYQRKSTSPTELTGTSPPNSTHWKVLGTNAFIPTKIEADTNLDDIVANGDYYAPTKIIGASCTNLPEDLQDTSIIFLLSVRGDTEMVKVQTLMDRGSACEYTRILANGSILQDWYKSKDPTGLDIVAVSGAWIFNVENGHLILYYDDTDDAPNMAIDTDETSDTYGHLIYTFDED